MKIDLDELNGMSEADLRELTQIVDQYTRREAAKTASEKFNRTIRVPTLQRFIARSSPKDFLDDCEHTKETAGQILQFAATGQVQFTEASVHVLEQTAFKLTFTCAQRTEDMQALSQIQTMLFRHRNAAVRERTATVQEQKAKLREREVVLKETLVHLKIEILKSKIAEASLSHRKGESREEGCPAPKKPWEMNEEEKAEWFKSIRRVKSEESIERDWLKIGIDRKVYREYLKDIPHPTGDEVSAAQQAGKIAFENRKAAASEQGSASVTPAQAPNTPGSSSLEGSPESPISNQSAANPPIHPSTDDPQTNVQPAAASLSLSKGEGQGEGSPQSSISVQQSTTCPATAGISNQALKLESSVRDHLTRRALEWQRNGKNTRATVYRECPCGNATPCKQHGEFPEWFWQCSPWNGDLALAMIDRGLPYFDIKLQPEGL
jgi:hypothetical protein